MLRAKTYRGIRLLLFLTWLNWRLSASDFKCQALGHLLHSEGRKFLAPEVGSVYLPCQLVKEEDGYFGSPTEESDQTLCQMDMH